MPVPGTQTGPKIITLTGDLASGKSTVGSFLSRRWGVDHYAGGDIMRHIALEKGRSLVDLNSDPLMSEWLDNEIDGCVVKLGQSDHDLIIDARLGWFFVPNSFKVKTVVDPKIAAERVSAKDGGRKGEIYDSLQQAELALQQRQSRECERFIRKYNADLSDRNNFDLVIDTSFADPKVTADVIDQCARAHFSGESYPHFWASPQMAIPTEDTMRKISSEHCDEIRTSIKEHGFDLDQPLEWIAYRGSYYNYDGHHRLYGALVADLSLVPVTLYQPDDLLPRAGNMRAEQHVIDNYKPSYFYDWQDAVNFCRAKAGLEKVDWSKTTRHAPESPFMPNISLRL